MLLVEEEDKMNNSSDVASVPNDCLYNGVQRRGIIADGIFCCGGYKRIIKTFEFLYDGLPWLWFDVEVGPSSKGNLFSLVHFCNMIVHLVDSRL